MNSPEVGRRDRGDLCPGVLRPWPAEDGALVRLRLVGGRVSANSLTTLMDVAAQYGDGNVHLTKRANLQLRALPGDGCLPTEVVTAITATGLLPAPAHELVRNIMVSPLSGLDQGFDRRFTRELQSPGDTESRASDRASQHPYIPETPTCGRADLRSVARALDEGLCAHPSLAALPGRFLFVLDDGRGDLVDRSLDLGLVAVSADECQLRIGTRAWGPVVGLEEAAARLVGLARAFLTVRGNGPTAPWHIDELPASPQDQPRDPRTQVHSPPPAYGVVAPGVEHVPAPDGVLTPDLLEQLLEDDPDHLVVTPWRSVMIVKRVV